ncbi:MAG: hypothetical protein J1E34_08765 [Oscillospiraceae bacterium]|nr:hypothetical protein [Oscillospiraceae bacterium]
MTNAKFNKRAIAVLIITAMIFVSFVVLIFGRQRTAAFAGSENTVLSKSYNIPVYADRGEILDRNGNTFVYNDQINVLTLNALAFPTNKKESNEIILSLIDLLESKEEEWVDELPIFFDEAGEIQFEEEREFDINWMRSPNFLNLNSYATAKNCFDALKEEYEIEDYSKTDAIKIASVRYNMARQGFSASAPYTFARDVSIQTVAYIKENGTFYKGVDTEIRSSRKYIGDGKIASHILGLVGAISSEEYNAEKEKTDALIKQAGDDEEKLLQIKTAAYSLTDSIGKNGIEHAMEQYLRGVNGVKTVTVSSDGDVSEEYSVMPSPGGTAILTLDIPMQEIAEKSLASRIQAVTDYSAIAGGMTPAGAVVVEDVKTGAILASASYPNFSLSTYYDDYEELSADAGKPLWNRAFQSGYSPGSTMKPASAIAALEEGIITPDSYFYCNGIYHYIDQPFVCFNKTAHGGVNVKTALAHSCNIFFFEAAQRLGIQKLNQYASLLGLGQKTGIEINETAGILAGYDDRVSKGQGWLLGETLLAAIGQSDNSLSPLQLTNYCATIANGGTRYVPYLVSKVLSSDYSEVLYERMPQVAVQTDISEETLEAVKQGMYLVANTTSCREQLGNLEYKVACKTGTAEKTRIVNGVKYEGTDGFLIAFGPYEDPEIAITVVVENAGSGASTALVAAEIFEYYFGTLNLISDVQTENTLL